VARTQVNDKRRRAEEGRMKRNRRENKRGPHPRMKKKHTGPFGIHLGERQKADHAGGKKEASGGIAARGRYEKRRKFLPKKKKREKKATEGATYKLRRGLQGRQRKERREKEKIHTNKKKVGKKSKALASGRSSQTKLFALKNNEREKETSLSAAGGGGEAQTNFSEVPF